MRVPLFRLDVFRYGPNNDNYTFYPLPVRAPGTPDNPVAFMEGKGPNASAQRLAAAAGQDAPTPVTSTGRRGFTYLFEYAPFLRHFPLGRQARMAAMCFACATMADRAVKLFQMPD